MYSSIILPKKVILITQLTLKHKICLKELWPHFPPAYTEL